MEESENISDRISETPLSPIAAAKRSLPHFSFSGEREDIGA